jgi:hypothetical protein
MYLASSFGPADGRKTALAGMEHKPQQDYTFEANLEVEVEEAGV